MPTSLGPAEILVILVVALIVLGPKRLPEAGRQVGKAIAEVRRWTNEVTRDIKSAVDVEAPLNTTVVRPATVTTTSTSVETRPAEPVEVVATDTSSAAVPAVVAEPEVVPTEPAVPVAEGPESPPGDPARL